MALSDIPADSLAIEPEVLAALGLTQEEMRDMGLRAFFERAMERGYDVTVGGRMRPFGAQGKLTITMDRPTWTVPAA